MKPADVAQQHAPPDDGGTRRHVRGSALLMGGRLVSVGINFLVQVLIVRHLAREDYGAFAYALAIVLIVQQLADLGLHRAVARFMPIYDEHRQADRLLGTVVLAVATVVTIGLAGVLVVHGLVALAPEAVGSAPEARALLLVLIALAPLQALDHIFEAVLAAIGSPRSIVIRKHLVGPGLKLFVVALLLVAEAGPRFLAVGYVAAGVLGVLVYVPFLVGTLRRHGVGRATLTGLRPPARELFAFGLPLLSADLMFLVRNAVDAVLVEYFHGVGEVAALRAVQPVARLNELVFVNFALLFTPIAARLFARHEQGRIDELYWTTALWQAVITFPVFAVTFALAGPATVLLFGPRYADAAPILALLSLGFFVNAALGQNALTLRVYGLVRYVVVGNLLAAGVSLGLGLLLIPSFGAVGAAAAACTTMIGQNLYNQVGLRRRAGITFFRRSFATVYATMGLGLAAVVVLQAATGAWAVGLLGSAAVSLVLLATARRHLDVAGTFPELLRVPFARRLLGTP